MVLPSQKRHTVLIWKCQDIHYILQQFDAMANHPDITTCAPLQIQSKFLDLGSGNYLFFAEALWWTVISPSFPLYEVTSNWVTFWVSFQYSYQQPECLNLTAKILSSNSWNTSGIFLYCPQFFSRLTHPVFEIFWDNGQGAKKEEAALTSSCWV